jgi:hypothetical protein
MLMNMAATWDSLAVNRQTHIERQARMAELEARTEASVHLDRLTAPNDE